jgi:hypothetical protein
MMELISKKDAILLGKSRYFTGKLCKHGHLCEKFVSNSGCYECARILQIENAKNHKDRLAKYSQDYRARDPLRAKKNHKKWRDTNPAKLAAWCRITQLKRENRVPSWVDDDLKQEMEDFYSAAHLFKIYTGKDYEVDHVVPIGGKTVCGLHVPWNLQIIERLENKKKSNKSWPDMW